MTTTSAFLFLTRTCNLACRHCYVSAQPFLKEHMDLDVFCKIVDYFVMRGIGDFRLTGGEPTLHPEFSLILNLFHSKGIAPRLITNGISLMQIPEPQSVLDKVSKCWISTYGISPQQHRAIGGARCRSLEDILDFAGKQSAKGHWVGVSALLTGVNLLILKDFITLAQKHGVRYLRFLFAEPSGRAATNHVAFSYGADTRKHAMLVVDYLRHSIDDDAFKFLSINNPFGLESKHVSGEASCMLGTRRMWSISPEGNIYSCCFNIDNSEHIVTNILSNSCAEALSKKDIIDRYASQCKGLDEGYWAANCGHVTCPISALTLYHN